MEMKSIQVFQLSMEDLSQVIRDAVKVELQKNNDVIQLKHLKEVPELLTEEETSKILDVSISTLYHMSKAGILPTKKIGGRVFYQRSTIMERLDCEPLPY